MDDVCSGLSGVRGSLALSFCLATLALVLAIKIILFPTYWTAKADVR